jgi:hypothetical protein
MSQYYNRLSELNGDYRIRVENRVRHYRSIGQLIIRHVVTFERYESSFRNFIEVNSYRTWSPYFLKFYEDIRPNQNDTTVFITFSSTSDHFDFVRIFDEMRFGQFNGLTKTLSVRVNGFTNKSRYNGDLGRVRFSREMIGAVKNFNNDIMRSRNDDGFRLVQPINNIQQREIDTQRQVGFIRQRAPQNNNNNNNNIYNNIYNNNNNNNNYVVSRRRQREPFTSSESTESLNEPKARRPNLTSLLDIKVEASEAKNGDQRAPSIQVIDGCFNHL